MNNQHYLRCDFGTIGQYSSKIDNFKIEIKDASVTQAKTFIPMVYPILYYHDNVLNKDITLTPPTLKVNAALAAVLRGTINPDPSAFYPLKGIGDFIDSALYIENKEDTVAKNVNFISVVPLVTPLVDGDNEQKICKLGRVYEDYYHKHQYYYPWAANDASRGEDYIDQLELKGTGYFTVIDWDTPIKISKTQRSDVDTKYNIYDPMNDGANLSSDENVDKTTKSNIQTVTHEISFFDSDAFYEHATQRKSIFLDINTEEGAKNYYTKYGEDSYTIPENEVDGENSKIAKVELVFVRVDTYFYPQNVGDYIYPNGIDDSILISIDKYEQNPTPQQQANVLGNARSYVTKDGYYDSTKPQFDTLVANEYSNVLRQYTHMTKYDPTDETSFGQLKQKMKEKLGNSEAELEIKLSHYLVPNIEEGVHSAKNLMNFVLDNHAGEGSGYLETYNSVKFIYAHSIDVVLVPEITRLGGIVEIKLGSYAFNTVKPYEDDKILVSADNVAFYKTIYDSVNKIIRMYFKRGLMPNESYGKDSKCQVYLEGITTHETIELDITLYQIKYDFTSPTLESEYLIQETKKYKAIYTSFFSFPALVMNHTLSRSGSTEMKEYELIEPYTRIGNYFQELMKHRYVWNAAEAHHRTKPGIQTINGGAAVLSNIGTSFIPFADYVTHGSGLLIPGAVHTSRIEWIDVWGREWVQNVRSLYPDVPPVPAPLKSFMMSTTFEILANDGKTRLLEWPSDEEAYVRVQLKFINNYEKYFIPTICKLNQYPYERKRKNSTLTERIFDSTDFTKCEATDNKHEVILGQLSSYGVCYSQADKAYLGGEELTNEAKQHIDYMHICAETNNATEMDICVKSTKSFNYPTLKRRDDSQESINKANEKKWNYSPLVESFYPDNYIDLTDMWDLTHIDYYDDAFMKGYEFHLDNNLPSLDVGPSWNPAYTKPHNFFTFPIFKGLGYKMDYSPSLKVQKFPKYKGWWSDNLQNKDNTLIAGQQKVNKYSVGSESLLKDSDWINWKEIVNSNFPNKDTVKERVKNIYTCLYNQHRIRTTPGQSKYVYHPNVVQNNVVPVLPDLNEDSEEYFNFDCKEDTYQYSPYNISQVDNRVYTANDRDWLYFALNLRSGAKENTNILLTLSPYNKDSRYEGVTKVQDGGRFTYWNPPNGPNSFLYVDNNVNTVLSKRVDLTITSQFYPTEVFTFNSDFYTVFNIEDPEETGREYKLSIYTNSYGYGDATTTIYVGGIENTSCKLYNANDFTYVKITLYNNAGFDWNLKFSAIDFEEKGSFAFNANDLALKKKTAIQVPTKYNFFEVEIPPELEGYIKVEASDHNAATAPTFFDFGTTNLVTIRDGFHADYFLKLTLLQDLPENLQGRLLELKVILKEEHFDMLPGPNDPTHIHDYKIEIPSIKFGQPFKNGKNANKLFYTLGASKNIKIQYYLYKYLNIKKIKLNLNENDIENLQNSVTDSEQRFSNLATAFENINEDDKNNLIQIKEEDYNSEYKIVTIDLTNAYEQLPYKGEIAPDITKINLAIKYFASQIPIGWFSSYKNVKVKYNDFRKDKSEDSEISKYNAHAAGPYFSTDIKTTLMDLNGDNQYIAKKSQILIAGQETIVEVKSILKNIGNAKSYHNNLCYNFDLAFTFIEAKLDTGIGYTITPEGNSQKICIGDYDILTEGDIHYAYFYFKFVSKENNVRRLEEKIELLKSIQISLCKTEADCKNAASSSEEAANQELILDELFSYTILRSGTASININNENKDKENALPKYKISVNIDDLNNPENEPIYYTFFRKMIIDGKEENVYKILSELSEMNTLVDEPFTSLEEFNKITSYNIFYRVEVYRGTKLVSSTKIVNDLYELTEGENEKNNSFPIWIVILLVVLVICLFAGFCIIYKCILTKKKDKKEKAIEEKESNFKQDIIPISSYSIKNEDLKGSGEAGSSRYFQKAKRSIKNSKFETKNINNINEDNGNEFKGTKITLNQK